jgi:ABC-type histidine transport system ATPase subunit
MSAPEPSAEALVEVEDLHAYYGKSHILSGVSLSVAGARSWDCSAATASARARP